MMAREVSVIFITELEQTDAEWEQWLNGVLEDFADVGTVLEISQEAV